MARFPKVPGAGAKRIGNPVYWSRMTIQNQRYRQTTANAVELWNTRYKALWHYYDVIWDDELEKVREFLTDAENEKLGDLNHAFNTLEKEIADNPYLDNAQLNKLKTRLKNFILFILKKRIKYNIFNNLETVSYDTQLKGFIINGDRGEPNFILW